MKFCQSTDEISSVELGKVGKGSSWKQAPWEATVCRSIVQGRGWCEGSDVGFLELSRPGKPGAVCRGAEKFPFLVLWLSLFLSFLP